MEGEENFVHLSCGKRANGHLLSYFHLFVLKFYYTVVEAAMLIYVNLSIIEIFKAVYKAEDGKMHVQYMAADCICSFFVGWLSAGLNIWCPKRKAHASEQTFQKIDSICECSVHIH